MKILTVCGMGMGTSLMLLMDIQTIAKNNGFNVDGEAVDLSTANGKDCDIIVASREISNELSDTKARIIPIDNIIDRNEIESKVLPVLKELMDK